MRYYANVCQRIFHNAFYADSVSVIVSDSVKVKDIIKIQKKLEIAFKSLTFVFVSYNLFQNVQTW